MNYEAQAAGYGAQEATRPVAKVAGAAIGGAVSGVAPGFVEGFQQASASDDSSSLDLSGSGGSSSGLIALAIAGAAVVGFIAFSGRRR